MPPRKNSTPIKPSEGSTMTHEEEEVLLVISKLQDQVQRISLSHRTKKNELEAKMDGFKDDMNGMEANINVIEGSI